MDALDWYYVYSPKYEIFHQLIYNSIGDCSGFVLHPCFFPQSAFSNLYASETTHFLSGSYIKFNVQLDAMKKHMGEYIVFSDADICVLQTTALRDYLTRYMNYDIVYMSDNLENTIYNIGFGLIKCTQSTIDFFTTVRDTIASSGRLDQTIVNELLAEYPELSVGMFSTPEMIQSNMYPVFRKEEENMYVVQMLCSGTSFEHNYLEKLLTASVFYDLRDLEQLIPVCIWNSLIKYLQDNNIPNPLASCEFKCVEPTKFDDATGAAPDAPTATQ
jgi:hypothetical protein